MSNWKQPSETIPYSKYLVLLKGVENIVICTCLLIQWTFCQFASLFMYTPVMNFKKRHYYQALYLKQVREYRANPLYWSCIVCHKQLLSMIGHSLLRFIAVSVVLHVYKCVRTDQLCLFYLPKFTVTTGPYLSLHFATSYSILFISKAEIVKHLVKKYLSPQWTSKLLNYRKLWYRNHQVRVSVCLSISLVFVTLL